MSRAGRPPTGAVWRRATVSSVGAALLILTAGCSGPDPTAAQPADPASASEEVLGEHLADDAPGCSAAVAREGRVVWAGARGLADVDAAVPLTGSTVFDLASVSKQLTAVAVLRLADQQALALTDTLADHVPGLPGWAASVTLDELLHHTAGVPDYTGLLIDGGTGLDEPAGQADALAAIAAVPELDTSGTFTYSNSHYVLLAEVVAAASGSAFGSYLEASVLGGGALRLEPAPRGEGVAVPYARSGDAWRPTPSAWTQVGDGSVVGSPSDLVTWADVYRTDPALRQRMAGDAVETGAPDGTRYGRGLVVAPDGSLSHAGGWSGYSTLFGITPDSTTVIAVSCNADGLPISEVAGALLRTWG